MDTVSFVLALLAFLALLCLALIALCAYLWRALRAEREKNTRIALRRVSALRPRPPYETGLAGLASTPDIRL